MTEYKGIIAGQCPACKRPVMRSISGLNITACVIRTDLPRITAFWHGQNGLRQKREFDDFADMSEWLCDHMRAPEEGGN